MTERLTGLIAAPHTPLDGQGQLRLEVVERQARHLHDTGVSGVFLAGSTGEGISLTCAERRLLLERWLPAARPAGLKVIAHVGSNCLPEAQRLAAHAQQQGADAIAAFAPCYYQPETVTTLIAYCRQIAASAADTPFYFYDIPAKTGARLPMVDFLQTGGQVIPTLQGLKYSNHDQVQFQECLQVEHGRFDILHGVDETLLAGLSLGAQGAVGSTYNFAAPLYLGILQHFHDGDLAGAARLQLQSVRMIRAIARYGFASACKSVMRLIGIDCGPPRPPLPPLSPDQEESLGRDLEAIGFFNWSR